MVGGGFSVNLVVKVLVGYIINIEAVVDAQVGSGSLHVSVIVVVRVSVCFACFYVF